MRRTSTMQDIRRLTQGLFLLFFFFLFIQTESKGNDELGYPVRLFLDFDPLILLTTLLSSARGRQGFRFLSHHHRHHAAVRQGVLRLGLPPRHAEQSRRLAREKPSPLTSRNRHRVKYYLLIGILASAVFTLQPAGIMDPLSLLIRSFSLSVYPLFNYGVRSLFDTVYAASILSASPLIRAGL